MAPVGGHDHICREKEKSMKKKLLILICSVALMATTAQAGLFKNSVDLADLSEVSPQTLETLKETEFAVFVAQVNLNAAKAAERRAAGGVKAANRTLEAEELDLNAAKAELKAAKANQDDERITAATARIAGAEEDIKTAKALRTWKAQEQEARQAEVAMTKSALDLAEANRDLARVRLLKQENATAGQKYDLADLERNASKQQKNYDGASRKAGDKIAKIDKAKADWDRLAKNIDLTGTE